MAFSKQQTDLAQLVLRMPRPARGFSGLAFHCADEGALMLTPACLFARDLVFAVDSILAVFAITQARSSFIPNICAISARFLYLLWLI